MWVPKDLKARLVCPESLVPLGLMDRWEIEGPRVMPGHRAQQVDEEYLDQKDQKEKRESRETEELMAILGLL